MRTIKCVIVTIFYVILNIFGTANALSYDKNTYELLDNVYAYSKLSEAVYNTEITKPRHTAEVLVGDETFEVIRYSPITHGFFALAYKSNKTGEIIVSFRGTDGIDDLIQDLGSLIGNSQLNSAKQFAKDVINENPGATISFTGHSLGGSLAQYAAFVTRKNAATFNAGPIPLSLIASSAAYNVDNRNIINLRRAGDPLSEELLGKSWSIGQNITVDLGNCTVKKCHSIVDFVKYIEHPSFYFWYHNKIEPPTFPYNDYLTNGYKVGHPDYKNFGYVAVNPNPTELIASPIEQPLPKLEESKFQREPDITGIFRGFVAGTVGQGSLFTHSAATENNGQTPLTAEPITIIAAGDDVSIVTNTRLLDYSYATIGSWIASNVTGALSSYPGSSLQSGHFVVGRTTTVPEYSKLGGSATYSGQMAGTSFGGEIVDGIINLTADFDMERMTGNLQFQRNGTPWVNATAAPMALIEGSDSVTYNGQLEVEGGGQGVLSGILYDETAQGTGGDWAIWDVPDTIGGADGVYLAQKGQHTSLPIIPLSVPSGPPLYVGKAVKFGSSCGGPFGCGGLASTSSFKIRALVDIQTLGGGTNGLVSDYNAIQNSNTFSDPRYVLLNSNTIGNYQYTEWGTWSRPLKSSDGSPDTSLSHKEHWVLGQATLPNDMPKYGSATFNGEMQGYYRSSSYNWLAGWSSSGNKLLGNIQLNANFANSTIDGNYSLRRSNNNVHSFGNINSTNIANGANSVGFESTFNNGAANYGSIDGIFNGPKAEEVSGGWELNNAKGVYRAKR